jgi:replicative DNA helicase
MDLLGVAESNVRDIVTRNFHGHVLPIKEVLKKTWDIIDMMMSQKGGGSNGLLTHFTHLDQMLTGLHEDELIIVAGRPAMGKTTFALNMLRNVVTKGNFPAVLFTLEMSAENIARNMLCAQGRIDAQKLRNHSFNRDEMKTLSIASGELQDAPFFIDETPAISLSELRGKARHLKIRHDIRLIVIDYLQLMTASSVARNRSREQEVSEISRGLKALAKELHIPVVALSQLSRKPEGRTNPVPILSDLRESGAIEQDADVVLMLHRPEYYAAKDASDADRKAGEAEVIIAKQRNGPTGVANMAFIGNQLRFENLAVNAGYDPSDNL